MNIIQKKSGRERPLTDSCEDLQPIQLRTTGIIPCSSQSKLLVHSEAESALPRTVARKSFKEVEIYASFFFVFFSLFLSLFRTDLLLFKLFSCSQISGLCSQSVRQPGHSQSCNIRNSTSILSSYPLQHFFRCLFSLHVSSHPTGSFFGAFS